MLDDALVAGQKVAAESSKWPVYDLYGLTFASDFPFANRLARGTGSVDLTFTCVKTAPLAVNWDEYSPAYASALQLDSGQSLLYVYRQNDRSIMRFTEIADYYMWPDHIVCHLLDKAYGHLVEIHLLGIVFSIWLELRKIPVLHASAVVVGDHAVAFLATNKGGKSSLAASLMQAGYPLLTDDVLPIEHLEGVFRGRAGYPQMRMWPEQAQHFLRHYENLDIVHPAYSKRRVAVGEDGLGTFCDGTRPLACFYIPERRDPADWGLQVEITPVPRGEALMSLVGESFASHLVEALGLQSHRLGFLASLVSQVPMRHIVYPESFDHLPRVRRAILNDLANLQSL